jgi:hypothetical protein
MILSINHFVIVIAITSIDLLVLRIISLDPNLLIQEKIRYSSLIIVKKRRTRNCNLS